MILARWFAFAAFASLSSAVAAQSDYTLLVFGDSGTGKEDQKLVAAAMAQVCQQSGCDAAIVLGDLIYPRGVESVDDSLFKTNFEEPYAGVGPFPFWMSLGNHDHKGSIDAQVAYGRSGASQRWKMPAAYYAVEGLPDWLHIYALDTEVFSGKEKAPDPVQAEQARAALCGKSGWRLLMGHHPIYSHGVHGSNAHVSSYLDAVIRDCRVQAYFAGHDHHQEHISAPSLEQFIEGAAAKLRRVKQADPADGTTQRFARSTLGFAIAAFTERTMDVRFFDATTGNAVPIYQCHATIEAPACVPQQ
jgi:tartrate-resistant acid phosphatase type 5